MSASAGPMGADVLYERLIPLNGQPDVVDDAVDLLLRDLLPDAGFDVVAKPRSLFDTSSSAAAQVKTELTAVH